MFILSIALAYIDIIHIFSKIKLAEFMEILTRIFSRNVHIISKQGSQEGKEIENAFESV